MREHAAGEFDAALDDTNLGVADRLAIPHAAAGGLAGSVGARDGEAELESPGEQRHRCRLPTDEDAVEAAQDVERVILLDQPRKLGRHEGDESHGAVEVVRRIDESGAVGRYGDRLGLCGERAHQHVDSSDVVGREGHDPLSRPAQVRVGGRGARQEGISPERHALRTPGRAARLHDDRYPLFNGLRQPDRMPRMRQDRGTIPAQRIPKCAEDCGGVCRVHNHQRSRHLSPWLRRRSAGWRGAPEGSRRYRAGFRRHRHDAHASR